MSNETSKATARPWTVSAIYNGRIVGDETAPNPVDSLQIHGPNATVATVYRRADIQLIVERVNGWEALVAERDRLRADVHQLRLSQDGLVGQRGRLAAEVARLRAERDRLREALAGLLRWTDCFPEVKVDENSETGADIPVVAAARAALEGGAR